ncbi:unnamed protein product [Brachionus calyciflorus]|uniref:Vesicle-trafficking protein SEC22b n=1 Tax=Brachionus calyciflorus TaxID=104777 RepID=A0A813YBG9_9BILA|nr:unnamed protein product [Brachionus calyciflorus]
MEIQKGFVNHLLLKEDKLIAEEEGKMLLMTMIARLGDALPLAASVQDEIHMQSGRSLVEYQNQAKQLFKRMNQNTPSRGSVETGEYLFHYFIDQEVCYLTMCDKQFSKRTAFSYLEDLATQFFGEYGNKVKSVARPYSFIEFDSHIQKTKKQYLDTRRSNMNRINTELQEVHKIMVQNIDDVLQRGEALTSLDDKAANLRLLSDKYKKNAHNLNKQSTMARIGAVIVVIIIFFLVLYYYLF